MLLMLLWGAFNGLTSRAERSSWTNIQTGTPIDNSTPVHLSADELIAASQTDHFAGRLITRVAIVAAPDSRMHAPGLSSLPRPGEYYASPALAALIASNPANELGNRYGTQAGLIADSALAGPDSLVVVVGQSTQTLSSLPTAKLLTGPFALASTAFVNENYRTVAIIGGIAIMLPVLLLVSIVTQLGAAERAERLSTLRLIGARPAFVARLAALETGVISLVGALIGVVLSILLVPLEAQVSIENTTFFQPDLRVGIPTTIGILAVTMLATTLAAWYRTRRAPVGPLGVTRQRSERRPRPAALVVLVLGVLIMLGATAASLVGGHQLAISLGRSYVSLTQPALIGGFTLTAIGLLIAGPILTNWISRSALSRANNAADLIALNRIRRHPRATFRAVGGLVFAIFIISVFAGAATTAAGASATTTGRDYLPAGTLTATLDTISKPDTGALNSEMVKIAAIPGVRHVAIGYADPSDGLIFQASDLRGLGLPTTGTGLVHLNNGVDANTPAHATISSARDVSALSPAVIWVTTNGSSSTVERVRTVLVTGPASLFFDPTTRFEDNQSSLQDLVNRYKSLANLGILIATLISAISLAISTTVSIIDRKRVLGLLRLTGMPAHALRRMILMETAVPLLAVFVGCIGLGFISAWCIVAGLTGGARTISWPDASYYIVIAVSLALALVAILATFSTARRNTAISSTRFE
jgi:ABC-type antimicrobial peptide transport system permease subunit